MRHVEMHRTARSLPTTGIQLHCLMIGQSIHQESVINVSIDRGVVYIYTSQFQSLYSNNCWLVLAQIHSSNEANLNI